LRTQKNAWVGGACIGACIIQASLINEASGGASSGWLQVMEGATVTCAPAGQAHNIISSAGQEDMLLEPLK
jgi:hypothetical protein